MLQSWTDLNDGYGNYLGHIGRHTQQCPRLDTVRFFAGCSAISCCDSHWFIKGACVDVFYWIVHARLLSGFKVQSHALLCTDFEVAAKLYLLNAGKKCQSSCSSPTPVFYLTNSSFHRQSPCAKWLANRYYFIL